MNRPKNVAVREALLQKATHYVMTYGVANLSLRPMAEEIGTTARMLVHHFGSKEALVSDVLKAIEADFVTRAEACFKEDRTVAETVMLLWQETRADAMEPALRAMFEIWGEALIHPESYKSYLDTMVAPWILLLQQQIMSAGVAPSRAKVLATLIMGSFSGLQLVRLTNSDDQSTQLALTVLLETIESLMSSANNQ